MLENVGDLKCIGFSATHNLYTCMLYIYMYICIFVWKEANMLTKKNPNHNFGVGSSKLATKQRDTNHALSIALYASSGRTMHLQKLI